MKDILLFAAGLLWLSLARGKSHGASPLIGSVDNHQHHFFHHMQEMGAPVPTENLKPHAPNNMDHKTSIIRSTSYVSKVDRDQPNLDTSTPVQSELPPSPQNQTSLNQTESISSLVEKPTMESVSPAATLTSTMNIPPAPSVAVDQKCRDACIGLRDTSASDMLRCYTDCTGKPEALYAPTSVEERSGRASSTTQASSDQSSLGNTMTYSLQQSTPSILPYDMANSLHPKINLLPIIALLSYFLL